jgi:hypothetical protein
VGACCDLLTPSEWRDRLSVAVVRSHPFLLGQDSALPSLTLLPSGLVTRRWRLNGESVSLWQLESCVLLHRATKSVSVSPLSRNNLEAMTFSTSTVLF